MVYRVLSGKLAYQDIGAAAYNQRERTRQIQSLRKRATLLGLQLFDPSTGEIVLNANPVS